MMKISKTQKLVSLVVIGVSLVMLVLVVLSHYVSRPEVHVVSQTATIMSLSWPKDGQTSIGTVEDGLIATRSNQKPRPIASVAKVITALVVLDKRPLDPDQDDPFLTINAYDVKLWKETVRENGSNVPVSEGEQWTEREIITGMLLASGNNLADSLAIWAFGSLDNYQVAARAWLQKHDLLQTNIGTDASGLDPATASSVDDLFQIGVLAMNNSTIRDIVRLRKATLPSGEVENTNELLGIDNMVGIKTGTTRAAGACLLFAAEYRNQKTGKVTTVVGASIGQKDPDGKYDSIISFIDSAAIGLGIWNYQ